MIKEKGKADALLCYANDCQLMWLHFLFPGEKVFAAAKQIPELPFIRFDVSSLLSASSLLSTNVCGTEAGGRN